MRVCHTIWVAFLISRFLRRDYRVPAHLGQWVWSLFNDNIASRLALRLTRRKETTIISLKIAELRLLAWRQSLKPAGIYSGRAMHYYSYQADWLARSNEFRGEGGMWKVLTIFFRCSTAASRAGLRCFSASSSDQPIDDVFTALARPKVDLFAIHIMKHSRRSLTSADWLDLLFKKCMSIRYSTSTCAEIRWSRSDQRESVQLKVSLGQGGGAERKLTALGRDGAKVCIWWWEWLLVLLTWVWVLWLELSEVIWPDIGFQVDFTWLKWSSTIQSH